MVVAQDEIGIIEEIVSVGSFFLRDKNAINLRCLFYIQMKI